MNGRRQFLQLQTRRCFLRQSSVGIGGVALAALLDEGLLDSSASAKTSPENPLAPKAPHFPAKAKHVISLHMAGAPPQLELFDYKPALQKMNGQPCPESLFKKERFAFIKGVPKMLGTPYKFAKHGRSGVEMSELLPHLAGVADELAVIRSMHTDQFNHAPAQIMLYTGSPRHGRPGMGAWVTYGLGSESQDLPGFVTLVSGGKTPDGGTSLWGSGFLPTVYQGVQCRSQGEPVLFVSDPPGMSREVRRRSLDALKDLNEMQLADVGDPEIATRIAQFELAYRMQASVPEAMDIHREPKSILDMYGAKPGQVAFANNCLLARRLIERGVRFVQLFDWGWDIHGTGPETDIFTQLPKKCRETDRPIAALIKDLKQRGLLNETLIIWSGEFGRTPMNEERNGSKFFGRDHHPHSFTTWMAGGGVRGGTTYGATDELGYHASENRVHVHDLQATILHLLGLDHTKLTYKFQGREYRLTDVFGSVVQGILA
jgi:hypothetical protein